jgi:hypothetical protein
MTNINQRSNNLFINRPYFIVVILVLFQVSCKKYLDTKSNSSIVTPTTLNDFQEILDDASLMNIKNTPSFGEASADDYFVLSNTYNSFQPLYKHIYTWTPDVYNYANDWSVSYRSIYNSNLCLEGLAKIPVSSLNELEWNNVKGSALFYRAYNFLNLSWVFSKSYDSSTFNNDLGIVLRLSSDFNIPSVRSNVNECYKRIIQDATEAAIYLPSASQSTLRPSKGAAYGLLARAYLSMRLYDSAKKYADFCLQLNNYLMDYNGDPGIGNLSATVPFKQFNKEIIYYSEMYTGLGYNDVSTAVAKIDTMLYASYANNELRRTAFFILSSGYPKFKGSYAASSNILFTGIATDEMYLIRAECYARKGQKDPA